jgi:hypothetical protein
MADVYVVVIDSTEQAFERMSEGAAEVVLLARDFDEEAAIKFANGVPDQVEGAPSR